MIVYLRGSRHESERENATSTNCNKALYLYPLSSKWSSNSEPSCSWMPNLLNCSAHLKSTAKDLKPDAVTVCLWSQGYPSSVMQCGKWDLQLLSAFPWGAHAAAVVNVFPFQCHLGEGRRLWHCISVCFLQQLSSQQEVLPCFFCFLALLAYWALKLQSHPFSCQPVSTLCFYLRYNNHPPALLSSTT